MTSAIDKLKALQRHTVHIADWDADVEFHVLPALELVDMHERLIALGGETSLQSRVGFFIDLLSRCMVGFGDAEGKELLQRAKLTTLLELAQVAMRLHGLRTGDADPEAGDAEPPTLPKKTA